MVFPLPHASHRTGSGDMGPGAGRLAYSPIGSVSTQSGRKCPNQRSDLQEAGKHND
jgi:hypothetical protein